jgi:hypothetical protein
MSLDALQWPAMMLTLLAAWFVASRSERRRRWGFWIYLASNAAWVAWGVPAGAWGVVVLQFCLAAMNVRGARRNAASASESG